VKPGVKVNKASTLKGLNVKNFFFLAKHRAIHFENNYLKIYISHNEEHSLSKSDCTLKGSARGLVGFSLLELLDDGFTKGEWYGNFRLTALVSESGNPDTIHKFVVGALAPKFVRVPESGNPDTILPVVGVHG
jgi:hypothetical protein